MTKYLTKQRRILLNYLSEHADEMLSAREIADGLADQGISVSAVYRNLSALEEEKLIHRVNVGATREIFYQYVGAEACRERIHLSCLKCGRTFHLEQEMANRLIDEVGQAEQFAVSRQDTILYGVCAGCSGAESRNGKAAPAGEKEQS